MKLSFSTDSKSYTNFKVRRVFKYKIWKTQEKKQKFQKFVKYVLYIPWNIGTSLEQHICRHCDLELRLWTSLGELCKSVFVSLIDRVTLGKSSSCVGSGRSSATKSSVVHSRRVPWELQVQIQIQKLELFVLQCFIFIRTSGTSVTTELTWQPDTATNGLKSSGIWTVILGCFVPQ